MYQVTEKSTVAGLKTPFGKKTPFKFPNPTGTSLSDLFFNLASQLYPTGRAFNMFKKSIMEKFHSAINVSFVRLLNDAQLTIDSCFPDNDNFDENDCALWEYRFGITTNQLLDLPTRKQAIYRRMSRGRNVPARQHILYIENQLQLAGFDVYVYENGFIEGGVLVHKRPEQILATIPPTTQHGGVTQHGIGVQHGGVNTDIIANSYLPNESYGVGDNYLSKTFFIGGATLGATAIVPENREQEFRELVLKLKPAHLAAFIFIDFL
ncbi:MAG: hypothetical protein ACK518_04420 [bacterium]|jgi:hypothetical protein